MTSSLAGAVAVAKEILWTLREGCYGYCGTSYWQSTDIAELARDLHGIWIYRVKATGRIERRGVGEWTTSFPVRILEIVRTVGDPVRNRMPSSPLWRDLDMAALVQQFKPQEVVDAFVRGGSEREILSRLENVMPDEVQAELVYRELAKGGREPIAVVTGWLARAVEDELAKLRSQRLESHRKLVPDARYRREQRWKRDLGE